MKKISAMISLLLPTIIFSQENFEGIVLYETNKYGINSTRKMLFGKSKIKIEATMYYKDSSQTFSQNFGAIFDFDAGTTTQYSSRTKRYTIDTLSKDYEENEPAFVQKIDSSITILGVRCNQLFFNEDSISKMSSSKNYIWYSDQLKYIVPNFHKHMPSLSVVGGNILSLQSVQILSYYHPLEEAYRIDTIITTVISIQKKKLKKSRFSIPRNYKLDDGSDETSLGEILQWHLRQNSKPPSKKRKTNKTR
jgi:hypothetical protein